MFGKGRSVRRSVVRRPVLEGLEGRNLQSPYVYPRWMPQTYTYPTWMPQTYTYPAWMPQVNVWPTWSYRPYTTWR